MKVRLVGVYSHHVGAPEHAFELEANYPDGLLSTMPFDFRSIHLPHVVGSHRAMGGGIVLGGRELDSGATVTLVVEVLRPGMLDGKGTIVFSDGIVWPFHFEAFPIDTQNAKANVVKLDRRA